MFKIVTFRLDKIHELIFSGEPKSPGWIRRIIVIVLWIPTSFYLIEALATAIIEGNSKESLYYVGYTYRMILTILPMLMYLEAVCDLEQRGRSIVTSLQSRRYIDLDALAEEKSLIRERIAALNDCFNAFLALIDIQMFMEAILAISFIVTSRKPSLLRISGFLRLISLMVPFLMARQSSRLIDTLVEAERLTLRRLSEVSCTSVIDDGLLYIGTSNHSCCPLQWDSLRFDDEVDSPRKACFVNSQQNFISSLSTSVTCLAIVMQFDYKIAWVVQNLAYNYGSGKAG